VELNGIDLGGGIGGLKHPSFFRFILSHNIAVHCILRGEYPNICILVLNNISAPLHFFNSDLCRLDAWGKWEAVGSTLLHSVTQLLGKGIPEQFTTKVPDVVLYENYL